MDIHPTTINRQHSTEVFQERVGHLVRLPFVSDDDFAELYSREVTALVTALNRANDAASICSDCGGKCCSACGCELYSEQFDWCPIPTCRPVVCRMHFCHRFEVIDSRAVSELSDVFFDCLLALEARGDKRVRLFDSPPLARNAPELIETASGWMSDLKSGAKSPEQVTAWLRREVARFRTV